MLRVILLILLSIFSSLVFSQNPTIGLRYINYNVSDGYTLFTPESNNFVYLIDNCGEVKNKWEFNEAPGATCYLLENGNLLRAGKDNIQIKNWNDELVWSFDMNSLGVNQHHDIEPLPNGNILCIVTEVFTPNAIIELGRNPNKIDNKFRLDKIIEIKPTGIYSGDVIWEWKFSDHLIQNFDPTKENYGNIEEYPGKIDINFDNGFNDDFTHVNAIDYNEDLDQILITVRHLSEIMIIDHSLSMAETASEKGDILWRWGNPSVYKNNTDNIQHLFWPHDAKWVEKGYVDFGSVSVFNNGGDGSFEKSSIHLIKPEFSGSEYTINNGTYLPSEFSWSWEGSVLNNILNEKKKGGALSLHNGNFIICETSKGQFFEINKSGEILWVYKNPSGLSINNQYEDVTGNSLFRAEKYPNTYVGFNSKVFGSNSTIEDENDLTEKCKEHYKNLNAENITENALIDQVNLMIVNPVYNGQIKFVEKYKLDKFTLVDINGHIVLEQNDLFSESIKANLPSGVYFAYFSYKNYQKKQQLLIIN